MVVVALLLSAGHLLSDLDLSSQVAAAKQPIELGKRQRKTVIYNEADLAKAKGKVSPSSSSDEDDGDDSDASIDVVNNSRDPSGEDEGAEKKVCHLGLSHLLRTPENDPPPWMHLFPIIWAFLYE